MTDMATRLLLAMLLAAAPIVAQAQEQTAEEEARSLFEAGRLAFADARYAEALTHFQRAYELSRRPELLYNVGQAADRLRDDETARAAFEQYLRERPEAPNRREVETRVAAIRAAAAPVPAPEPEPAPVAPSLPPSRPLLEEEWFWAVVGASAACIAGGVAIGAVTYSPGTVPPLPGDVGPQGVVIALGGVW